jgi:hypothetical protein
MTILPLTRHICVTRLGQESFISKELSPLSDRVKCTELAPQVVELTGVDLEFLGRNPILFSRQLLPDAVLVEGDSIKGIANGVVSKLIDQEEALLGGWHLHIFDPPSVDSGEEYSRPRLIHQEILSLLKQKRRSLLKTISERCSARDTLVQVLVAKPTKTFLSITTSEVREPLRSALLPHRAGFVLVPDDKTPPSRAFKKLREAIEVFHLKPMRGEMCVDLGACPGGWTHVMVEHGLKVIAIDRSPLDDRLMRHTGVTFVKGDAFTWVPKAAVDWLICDVITSPDKTQEILDRWLSKALCKNFCVTVKFKGTPEFDTLAKIRELILSKTEWFDGKQLTNNKNELTVVGRIAL